MSEKPTTPIVPTPEAKMDWSMMMDDKKMMNDDMIKKDTMMSGSMEKPMMDDKMMSDSWTHEEMDAMSGEHMMDDKKMMDDDMMKKDDSNMMKPTGYMEYDSAKVSEALKNWQKVALFFHASWCPSCRALDKAILEDISSIPTDALIVKVDYDNSEEMKKKYSVTSQHTTVIIDADMALVSKKLGAKSVSEVLN